MKIVAINTLMIMRSAGDAGLDFVTLQKHENADVEWQLPGIMLAAFLPIIYTVADMRLRWFFILPAVGVAVYTLAALVVNAPALRERHTVGHNLLAPRTGGKETAPEKEDG